MKKKVWRWIWSCEQKVEGIHRKNKVDFTVPTNTVNSEIIAMFLLLQNMQLMWNRNNVNSHFRIICIGYFHVSH